MGAQFAKQISFAETLYNSAAHSLSVEWRNDSRFLLIIVSNNGLVKSDLV